VKIRILFVVYTVAYGGLEKHLLELIRRLDASSVECTILCYGPDVYSRRLGDRPDVRVLTPSRGRPHTFFWSWLTFVRLKPHVTVFVKGSIDSFPLKAYVAAKLSGARKLFAIEHNLADPVPPKETGKRVWDYVRRVAGWRARHVVTYVWGKKLAGILVDKTICVSESVRQRLVGDYGFPADKTVTIMNGVDLRRFGSTNGNNRQGIAGNVNIGDHEPIIVCASRLVPPKRVDLLLDAFSLVLKEHPSAKCLIVGSGRSEEQLRAKSIELGMAAAVRFTGFAEDVRPYLEMSDIYVSASDKEGFGISLIEAMAYRLPCIATNIGGHNEIILPGHNGLLVPPNSAEELAKAITYLLVHKEEREKMGLNGRKTVEEHFNTDNTMAQIKNVLLGEV
jgi:glycosyltransferase involved in cell wall biosynthesis